MAMDDVDQKASSLLGFTLSDVQVFGSACDMILIAKILI
jgi:hypothetical protein